MKIGLFATFARLAESPPPHTGAWRIRTDDDREGLVLMEDGRVCWANHALSGRLSDHIERRYGVSRAIVDDVIRECRDTRRPFGALLIERGFLTPPQLAAALRDHICHSILALVRSGIRDWEWIPHQGAGYAAETTLSVAQAMSRCAALVKRLDPDGLEAALETMLAGEAAGLLIGMRGRLPLAASTATVSWQELRRWLSWILHVDTLCSLPSRGYVAGRGHDGGWVMWRAGSMIGLAVSPREDVQRRLLLRVSSMLPGWVVDQPG